ncbi:uncharacterized protein LOC127581887 [Pristis pectinata]|uniref:uncharacterized protein LOC127581887 n=1 Tax=Pristis pectinata TaxID=685728 RepID=UPI00223E6958|nr:uncharacterized protein LOC127581887 [Pristis pectinata]
MSFWCGILFVITASFSLNVLYHDLFAGWPQGYAIPKRLLGSVHQPMRNGAVLRDFGMEFISPPMFNLHHPFTALLPAKQALEVQVEVKQEETLTGTDLEPRVETGLAVTETGLTVLETGLSVVESFKITSLWGEDNEEDMIIRNELSGESFQTCPAKDAESIKPKPVVKEERDMSVSEVISLGESKDTSAKYESATSEKEFYIDHSTFPFHLEHDVIVVLVAHLTLVISVLLLGCRSLHVQKRVISNDADVEELIVTVGLVSCITVALVALLGATIILFIRILLAKFP